MRASSPRTKSATGSAGPGGWKEKLRPWATLWCPGNQRYSQFLRSASLTFPSSTVSWSGILAAIEALLARAFARPQVRGKYVRSVIVESHILHHAPWVRQFPFKEAVGSKDRAFFVIKNALEDLTLTLAGLTGESGIQSSLFPEVREREQLRETLRQLRVQLGGPPPIYLVRDLEPWSRIPERRWILVRFDS
jgi:DNA polymerase-4